MRSRCCLCVFTFELLSKWPDFLKFLYEHYAIGDHSNLIITVPLQSLIKTWRTDEFERWEIYCMPLITMANIMLVTVVSVS
jgi:hypothetical protein